jgi:hypothetical protein
MYCVRKIFWNKLLLLRKISWKNYFSKRVSPEPREESHLCYQIKEGLWKIFKVEAVYIQAFLWIYVTKNEIKILLDCSFKFVSHRTSLKESHENRFSFRWPMCFTCGTSHHMLEIYIYVIWIMRFIVKQLQWDCVDLVTATGHDEIEIYTQVCFCMYIKSWLEYNLKLGKNNILWRNLCEFSCFDVSWRDILTPLHNCPENVIVHICWYVGDLKKKRGGPFFFCSSAKKII